VGLLVVVAALGTLLVVPAQAQQSRCQQDLSHVEQARMIMSENVGRFSAFTFALLPVRNQEFAQNIVLHQFEVFSDALRGNFDETMKEIAQGRNCPRARTELRQAYRDALRKLAKSAKNFFGGVIEVTPTSLSANAGPEELPPTQTGPVVDPAQQAPGGDPSTVDRANAREARRQAAQQRRANARARHQARLHGAQGTD
jgi:hypothetical protein